MQLYSPIMKASLLLCISLAVLGTARGQTQTDSFSINIIVTTGSIQNGEFATKIDKNGNDIKMVYSFRDSIAKAYYKDKRYLNLSSSLKKNDRTNSSENLKIFKALHSVEEEYSYYSKDSLSLNARGTASFTGLLEKIVTTSKEELENLEVSKKRNLLDGAYYSFIIKTNKGTKYVYAISPDPKTHPLLSQLTDEVLNIYRKEKHNNFLDKMSTLSY